MAGSAKHSFASNCVPKYNLGTRRKRAGFSGRNRCLRGGVGEDGVVWLRGCEAQLRRQLRSQVQLGNEGIKCKMRGYSSCNLTDGSM